MAEQGSERQPFSQQHLVFVLLATLVLMIFNPFRPPVEPPEADGEQAAAEQPADRPAEGGQPAPTDVAAEGGDPDTGAIEEQPAAPAQRATLGSLQDAGPYRMLVTLANTGAAVERIELSSSDFRDLDNRSGYLGALGLVKAADGVGAEVTVVGPGTPAAAAGLQVGDVIKSAAGKKEKAEVDTPQAFADWLNKTKPKEQATLVVQRSGQEITVTATLTRRPLALLRPEQENILLHRQEVPDEFEPAPSYRVTLDRVGDLTPESPVIVAANAALTDETWTIENSSASEIVFRKRLPGLKLELIKRFSLPSVPEDKQDDRTHLGYHLDLDVEVVNLAGEPQSVSYTIEGPNGLPIEGWWYSAKVGPAFFTRYGIRDVVARYAGAGPQHFACSTISKDEVAPMAQGASMAYIGVDAQYFAAALLPEKASLADVRFSVADTKLATPKLPDDQYEIYYNNPTFTVTTKSVEVPAGAAWKDDYVLFAGPKRPELLSAYFPGGDANYSLSGFSYYGWFGPVARVMLVILHGFYSIVGNYGLAIVLLTVLVRGCMHPISRRQAASMAKMQQLKPEMDRIAQKHKDDRQKQAQAQQELFRKHGVNPLGGCLPMFLQLPIFIGLYRALAVDIELRQAPLISESLRWCGNLAAPDMFFDWSWMTPQWFDNGQGIFALGPFFNLLPIATVALILIQQKMFMPEATSPEMEMQQKLMKYMMGFMGFLFFKWASGLAIYFITTSLWGIVERKMLPKPAPAGGTPPPSSSGGKSPPKKSSPSSGGGARSSSSKKKKGKKRK